MEDGGIAERRVGSTLKGKYTLERLIGVGGMAAVYKGVHRNGNRVAVKVLNPTLSGNADIRDRFLREGYVANKVDHRGAVRVLDDDEADDGSVFLVMELLEGETVGARWERNDNRLPQRQVVEIVHQLLEVLAAAHDKGIVHRDIKPENLFLTQEGVLKVLDFGIARLIDPLGGGHASATRSGRMLGTPAFMPPEQVLGRTRSIDGQTDLWSVGASMFSLISGQFVHAAETVEELLVYTGSRPARPIASAFPDVAPAIAKVVDRALAFEKSERWPSARAMQTALEQAYTLTFGTSIVRVNSSGASTADEHAPTLSAPPHSPAHAPTVDASSGSGSAPPPAAPSPSGPEGKQAATFPSASSTTGGISESAKPPPAKPRRGVWLGIAAAVTVAGVAGAVALSGHRSPEAAPSAASSPAVATPPPVPELPATVASAASSAAASVPAPVVEAGVASASPPPRPPPVAPHPVAPGPAAPVGKANCNPPYTIDSAGRRIPKPECL